MTTLQSQHPGGAAAMPGVSRRGQGSAAKPAVPPTSNTGGLIHPPSQNPIATDAPQTCVDWLSFTLFPSSPCDRDYDIRDWLSFFGGGHERVEYARYGYNRMVKCLGGYGEIMWHDEKFANGLHIGLSASALGIFQEINPGKSVYSIMIKVRDYAYSTFKRVDLAVDVFGFHISKVSEAIDRGELVTKARRVDEIKSKVGGDDHTIYIGKKKSDRFARIYNKAAEEGLTDGTIWTRFETVFKDMYADQVVDMLLLSDVSLESIICSSFDFREVGNTRTNNRERVAWFDALLGQLEKVVFTITKKVSSLEEKAEWIRHQVSRTLATAYTYFGRQWLDGILDRGVRNMTQTDWALISALSGGTHAKATG